MCTFCIYQQGVRGNRACDLSGDKSGSSLFALDGVNMTVIYISALKFKII